MSKYIICEGNVYPATKLSANYTKEKEGYKVSLHLDVYRVDLHVVSLKELDKAIAMCLRNADAIAFDDLVEAIRNEAGVEEKGKV